MLDFQTRYIDDADIFERARTGETANGVYAGSGKCTRSGCSCPSYIDPPGGFDCARCGHPKSDHW